MKTFVSKLSAYTLSIFHITICSYNGDITIITEVKILWVKGIHAYHKHLPKIFNANPHFFFQNYTAHIYLGKKVIVYKKAIIHEMYYEKNYKLRKIGKNVNIS